MFELMVAWYWLCDTLFIHHALVALAAAGAIATVFNLIDNIEG